MEREGEERLGRQEGDDFDARSSYKSKTLFVFPPPTKNTRWLPLPALSLIPVPVGYSTRYCTVPGTVPLPYSTVQYPGTGPPGRAGGPGTVQYSTISIVLWWYSTVLY